MDEAIKKRAGKRNIVAHSVLTANTARRRHHFYGFIALDSYLALRLLSFSLLISGGAFCVGSNDSRLYGPGECVNVHQAGASGNLITC